ncbi:hypothetical protein M3923_000623 [Vibrio metschnikovii]|uniref:CPBP family intramembrane metalloprotease n=1 Tax=bacterium 19MO03SA05 TaxID=2920620 RepID=A0AAU6VED3_UNCXX|nr:MULTISPECIES: hypothetical protein [Vibrio]EKO3570933.1 hypothetical protein [Vibrio metschnikovii]EKO3579197.1 hypothetical protein [Vibrio metschnikovii]EKO3582076.1 hypothetical protein [Vibrio metschnikovii]EKO3671993.1 hypothetical protein [Vibrio metschnikovii]EKO3705915.1 hypothetical protein [Vibrio metschnikovii]
MMFFLYNNNQSIVQYILKSYLVCVSVSVIISFGLFCFELIPEESPSDNLGIIDVIGGSLISPAIETIGIYLIIKPLGLFLNSYKVKSIIVASIFSYLHFLVSPIWGVTTFFSFFVFAVSFSVWTMRSDRLGMLVPFMIHFLLNFSSLIFVYISQFYYQ